MTTMFSTYLRRKALCTELEDKPDELGSWNWGVGKL
jgi:hypothetical protein